MYDVLIIPPEKGELTKKGFNKNIKINHNQTVETLMNYGFTNHHEPTLYYCKCLGNDITFNLSVNKNTLEIKGIDVLDENFLQPYDYQVILMKDKTNEFAKSIYYQVNEMLLKLQDDGVLEGFTIGMYV